MTATLIHEIGHPHRSPRVQQLASTPWARERAIALAKRLETDVPAWATPDRYYVTCSCRWSSKKHATPEDATSEGHKHLKAHGS